MFKKCQLVLPAAPNTGVALAPMTPMTWVLIHPNCDYGHQAASDGSPVRSTVEVPFEDSCKKSTATEVQL